MFKKRITPFACIVLCMIVCITTSVGVVSYMSVTEKAEKNEIRSETGEYSEYKSFISLIEDDETRYSKLAQLIALIEGTYIRDYDDDEVWNALYKSLAQSLGDDYSQYLTAEEYADLIDSADGEFVGIGVHATYDIDTGGVYIFGVIPDSPAEKAGLQKGDIIVSVEGIVSNDENYYTVLDAVRGESGTEVNITVLRNGEEMDFTLTRAAVASENVLYENIGDNIAYFRILSFADVSVAEEFTKKIAFAQSEGCVKFIFDVRNNSGGYLEEICGTLDLLLPEGPIINIVEKGGKTTTENSDANCISGKMAVLCNGATASAAELFAAALRDYDLAELVGETTFGKGTMQTTRLFTDGSAIKLSTAYYNPPSNVSYDQIGVEPDYKVELTEEWSNRFFKMPKEEDTQLQKAIEILNSAE